MTQPRCRLCGPYTPEQAALLVLGELVPPPTDYLCPTCTAGLKVAVQRLADEIDRRAYVYAMKGTA